MREAEFNIILKDRLQKIKDTLKHKGVTYSSVTDRLANFKKAGAYLGVTPESACLGMQAKHVISVLDIVDVSLDNLSIDIIDEKIGDAINYYILLEALLKERLCKQQD